MYAGTPDPGMCTIQLAPGKIHAGGSKNIWDGGPVERVVIG